MSNLSKKMEIESLAKDKLFKNPCFAWYDNKMGYWFIKLSGMSKIKKLGRKFHECIDIMEETNVLEDMREYLRQKGLDKSKSKSKGLNYFSLNSDFLTEPADHPTSSSRCLVRNIDEETWTLYINLTRGYRDLDIESDEIDIQTFSIIGDQVVEFNDELGNTRIGTNVVESDYVLNEIVRRQNKDCIIIRNEPRVSKLVDIRQNIKSRIIEVETNEDCTMMKIILANE